MAFPGGLRSGTARVFSVSSRAWDNPLSILWILIESFALIGAALALSHWLSPDDPFGIRAQFPWLWLVPALLALRYGTLDGVLGAALMLAWWFTPSRLFGAAAPPEFPQEYFLGGLVLVLGCGQFADVWNSRLTRIRAANGYLDDRLKSLTRAHYLLRLSHERIEQELLVRPVTLRDLLLELQAAGQTDLAADAASLAGCDSLMRLLAQSCELEDASIHRMIGGKLEKMPIAATGEPRPLNPDDSLLALALQRESLAHVQARDASLHDSEYLVCAPIAASNRTTLGMLVVRSMRFFSLNHENLQLIAVLLGYYADALARDQVVRPVLTLQPSCPADFALELVRLHRLRNVARIDSAMVGLMFEKTPEAESLYEQVRRMRRSIDLTWEIETPQRQVLITLLALAGSATVEGFLIRLEATLREQFGKDFATGHVGVHVAMLSEAEIEWTLDDLLQRCKVPAHPTPAHAGGLTEDAGMTQAAGNTR